MKRVRLIPTLTIIGNKLVKTVYFKHPNYIGDPINAIKIFNEKEVDEIAILDIRASSENRPINFSLIEEMASECFMPMSYGGGIKTLDDVKRLFNIGIEKIVLNTVLFNDLKIIEKVAEIYGCQSIVAALDIRKSLLKGYYLTYNNGRSHSNINTEEYIVSLEKSGIGEILINNIDRDGTFQGIDLRLTQIISNKSKVPVITCGGLNSIDNVLEAAKIGKSNAIAGGSFFLYNNNDVRSILINYPPQKELEAKVYKHL